MGLSVQNCSPEPLPNLLPSSGAPDDGLAGSNPETELYPFAPLVGQTANGCWLGYGSTLFLEFGERTVVQDLKNRRSGEWSLQCGSVLWRIEQGDCVFVPLRWFGKKT
jgi:hypothetical protein